MKEQDEVEYGRNWIEITTRESKGHFLASVRIAGGGPGVPGRQWAALEVDKDATFVDRESAYNYALKQAKNFVDKMNTPQNAG
ncbi:hypothetical protein H0A66_02985 [Alcaligenaceae bacterium]|nr:hypothetical protein [Alcaligenaceae bacterium]